MLLMLFLFYLELLNVVIAPYKQQETMMVKKKKNRLDELSSI